MRSKLVFVIVLLVLCSFLENVWAGTVRQTFKVTATVVPSCRVTTNSDGSTVIKCTKGTDYRMVSPKTTEKASDSGSAKTIEY